MAAFASSVKSILDIYSNCLLLLESLKKKSASDKASSRLRRSIRSDQAKIQNAYEKGLSRRGKSFSEGDDRARSAVRRVLRKLKMAAAQLVRLCSGGQSHLLDYDSLASLSTVSRIETVEAFDKLSLRLSSTGSSAKRRSSAAPSSTRSKTGNRKVSSGTASTSSPGRRRRDTSNKSGSDAGRRGRVSAKTDDHATKADRSKESYYVSAETWLPLTASEHRRQNPLPMQRNRDSIRSVSSASTRLGDLSRYGSSRQSFSSGDPNEYNVPVTYPLYPHYRPYEATPKRRFWHIFRSGSS